MRKKEVLMKTILVGSIVTLFVCSVMVCNSIQNTIQTSSNVSNDQGLSNKKIEWGIKRAKDHKQPDVGGTNQKLMQQYNGMYMGNKESKNLYLTFDEGYEAGYTEKILEILKQNNVKATFFITAHYFNSQPELVSKMVQEGHIIGNHTPITLMSYV